MSTPLTYTLCASILALSLSSSYLIVNQKGVASALVREEGDATRKLVAEQAEATRATLVCEAQKFRDMTDARLKDALTQTGSIASAAASLPGILDSRAAEVLRVADSHLTEATGAITETSRHLNPLLDAARATTAQVNEALPDFLECENADADGNWHGNPSCLFNRYVGVSTSVEQASIAIGRAAPGMAKSTESIAGDSAAVAKDVRTAVDKFFAPRTWFQELKSWFMALAGMASRTSAAW